MRKVLIFTVIVLSFFKVTAQSKRGTISVKSVEVKPNICLLDGDWGAEKEQLQNTEIKFLKFNIFECGMFANTEVKKWYGKKKKQIELKIDSLQFQENPETGFNDIIGVYSIVGKKEKSFKFRLEGRNKPWRSKLPRPLKQETIYPNLYIYSPVNGKSKLYRKQF